jgi:hypothetical protein
MMEAVGTSEMLRLLQRDLRGCTTGSCHVNVRRRENLVSPKHKYILSGYTDNNLRSQNTVNALER